MRAHAVLLKDIMHAPPRTGPRKLILTRAATGAVEADFDASGPQVIFDVN